MVSSSFCLVSIYSVRSLGDISNNDFSKPDYVRRLNTDSYMSRYVSLMRSARIGKHEVLVYQVILLVGVCISTMR